MRLTAIFLAGLAISGCNSNLARIIPQTSLPETLNNQTDDRLPRIDGTLKRPLVNYISLDRTYSPVDMYFGFGQKVQTPDGRVHWINKRFNNIPIPEGIYGGDLKGPVKVINWYDNCPRQSGGAEQCSGSGYSQEFDQLGRLVKRQQFNGSETIRYHYDNNNHRAMLPTSTTTSTNALSQPFEHHFTRNEAGYLTGSSLFKLTHTLESREQILVKNIDGIGELTQRSRGGSEAFQILRSSGNQLLCPDQPDLRCPPGTPDSLSQIHWYVPGGGNTAKYVSFTAVESQRPGPRTTKSTYERFDKITGVILHSKTTDPSKAPPKHLDTGGRFNSEQHEVDYGDYHFDEQGNWIARTSCGWINNTHGHRDEEPIWCRIEKREISYYSAL